VQHCSREAPGAFAQFLDALYACGVDVEADVRNWRALTDDRRASEVRTHERSDGVAVPARLSGAFGAEEHDLIGEVDILTPGALGSGARRGFRLPKDEPDGFSVELDDDVASAGQFSISPPEIVQLVPLGIGEVER